MAEPIYSSRWNRFWHAPVRAERLALMRILLGVALLAQQMLEFLPHLDEFYGPHGIAPAGLLDRAQLNYWFWTMLIFNTDDMTVIRIVFAVWVAVTLAFTVGFCTRLMNVAVWLLAMCFLARNFFLLDGGDDTLQVSLFLLMLSPSGRALSVDAWLRRRRGLEQGAVLTAAWPVRIIQVQLCAIYCTTGLVKLLGTGAVDDIWITDSSWYRASTWVNGTSIHYALNYLIMSQYSYASLPLPLWLTAPMTWTAVLWEALFPVLVSFRRTRKWTLVFGILFHLGIWFTLAIGWFSFYMIALYGVWVADECWARWCGPIELADPNGEVPTGGQT